jgi:hypothetical protein
MTLRAPGRNDDAYGSPALHCRQSLADGLQHARRPVHNAKQQILAPGGAPIPRLYAAGELGSSFGQLYLSGGNVTECLGPGRVAGRGGRVQHSIRDAEIDMVLRSTLPVRPMIT